MNSIKQTYWIHNLDIELYMKLTYVSNHVDLINIKFSNNIYNMYFVNV